MIRLWRLTKDMLWGVAAVLAAACSADAEVPVAADGRSPVTFSLGRSLTVGTRAANHTVGNSWEVGDALGVKCTASGEAGQQGTVKQYVVADNGGGLQLQGADAANTFWWLDKSDAKSFQLWYPYSAVMPTSMSVPADQGSVADLDAYDLLYAAVGSRTAANMPETSLAFYHQAARLTVNIVSVDTGDDDHIMTKGHLIHSGKKCLFDLRPCNLKPDTGLWESQVFPDADLFLEKQPVQRFLVINRLVPVQEITEQNNLRLFF